MDAGDIDAVQLSAKLEYDQLPLLTTGGRAHGLFLHCCLHRIS